MTFLIIAPYKYSYLLTYLLTQNKYILLRLCSTVFIVISTFRIVHCRHTQGKVELYIIDNNIPLLQQQQVCTTLSAILFSFYSFSLHLFVSQKSLNDEERGGNCLLVPELSYGPALP